MKNILKKDALDFISRIENILLNNDKVKEIKSYTNMRAYEVNSRFGRLEVHTETWEHLKGSSIYSIYTCFDDKEKVLENSYLDICRFTGKHNFHSWNKEYCILSFDTFLNYITENIL